MLGAHDVSQDEKDAVMLVGMLVRAGKKWDADPRIKKRIAKAEDWLRRYNEKHPHRMLRDGAVLSESYTQPMEQPILAKDMKWPHCKGSVVPSNTWNTGLEELMERLFNACEQPWWCCDTDLKYLNLRIDTRDNAFILSVDGRGDKAKKIRIDPQRVVDAIAEWNTKFEDDTDQSDN